MSSFAYVVLHPLRYYYVDVGREYVDVISTFYSEEGMMNEVEEIAADGAHFEMYFTIQEQEEECYAT
jgi:hypothetical protein